MLNPEIARHRAEFKRAIANGHYEVGDGGILFPRQAVIARGTFVHGVNGRNWRMDDNIVVTEGLNHMLATEFNGGAAVSTWYIAPFSGNVTPLATWTAANFTANSTEFTNYNEATRQEWVEAAPSAGSIDNLASKASFTIGVGGGTVWGGGLMSASAKSATTGTLMCAAKFASSRVLVETDVLQIGYMISLTSS